MSDLVLHVTGKYFDQIKAGTKPFEYRLQTNYWRKRLVGREYDRVVICLGYPASNDTDRRIPFPWRGYEEPTITHEHFGTGPVRVFAIKLEMDGQQMQKTAIEVGKTYINRAAGTTSRTVLRITDNPTEEETPYWWSIKPRPAEPVVIFTASNRKGESSLYLSSFASWAGREK